jgi:CRISPR-associated endoribonuclease Cas6
VKNESESVYSVILALDPIKDMTIPVSMGTKSHASFLNLVGRFNPSLMARLHDIPGYRPYTVSPLYGGRVSGERMTLSRAQLCHLRVTLLDGGALWSALQTYFREAGPIYIRLDDADFQLVRMFITPTADSSGWSGPADWQTLVTLPAQSTITMYFATATAFSMGEHRFCLFPIPNLVWESLLRTWNRYAPAHMYMEKQIIRESLGRHIAVTACKLHHAFLHFPTYVQKGFVGCCTYYLNADKSLATYLTTLAAFSHYTGFGYNRSWIQNDDGNGAGASEL